MYSLANLLKWKDRSFDLSDENDWLDLLDDFGPSLPRFLLDASVATQVPDGDVALSELRQSLVKHPVSSLKPEVGSAWVLFAFKDDLANLQGPFRKDGLLLPFEWRKGEEGHSNLLPEELVRLAEQVKAQFGDDAADCTLHPSRHFLDAVDFHIPGATFDSAWGALATGLYLLLSRKKQLTAWPFSTIAYDFENDMPKAVGGLAQKLLLAASAGVEEIAVAPVQYREAKKVLSELQAKSPKDKAFRRLRIYRWHVGGDLKRDLAVLSKCNQGGRGRQVWAMFSCIATIAGALLLAYCGWYWHDWHIEKIYYFKDYVDQFGIPKGLFPIEKQCIREGQQAYRFHFQGYNGFLPWRRKPVLRSVFCVDSQDKPVKDRSMLPLHPKTAWRKFTYGENGCLVEIRHLRPNGYETAIFRMSGASDEFIDVTRRGHDGQWGTPEWGPELVRGGQSGKLRRFAVQRDANGFVCQVSYLKDNKGIPIAVYGVGRETYEHDEFGRVTTRKTYACDGKRIVGENAKGDEFRYSFSHEGEIESISTMRNGKVIEKKKCGTEMEEATGTPIKKYGESGELMEERLLKKDGSVEYIVRYKYDPSLSYLMETTFFDPENNLANNAEGWAIHTIQYQRNPDGSGSCRTDAWLDSRRCPVNTKKGYASEIATFDAKGRLVKIEIFGSKGEKTIGPQDYHCARYEYDRFGFMSHESYFGIVGEPIVANLGNGACYHALHMVNDENGNIMETTTFGVDGKPMNIPSRGYAREVKRYDAIGRLIELSTFDADGNRACTSGCGYCRVTTRYDDNTGCKTILHYHTDGTYMKTISDAKGNLIQESYHNADDSLRQDENGIAKILYKYDKKNHELKRGFFDVNGQRVRSSDGIAGWENIYDERGDKIEERRFGLDGKTDNDNQGIAIIRWRYDEAHHQVAKDLFDAAGNPAPNNDGDYGERWEYDERGNKTASYSIGRNGKCKPDKNGVAIVRYEHDVKGRIMKRRFFDVDGKPVRNNEGIGGWSSQYDYAGNETCRMFFDENEKPCLDGGRAGWRCRFDEHGREIEGESLDCNGDMAPQRLVIGGIEMKFGRYSISYGRDGRKTVTAEGFKGGAVFDNAKKIRVALTRDGDMERLECMNEDGNLVNNSLGYARKEIRYNEFREVTEESWWDAEGRPAVFLPEMTHRTVAFYKRTKEGLVLDLRCYDADGFPVAGKTMGFARQVLRYDAQGRLLSLENFDERNLPKVCGKCAKLFVDYDSSGNAKTIFMQGADDSEKVVRMRIDFWGDHIEYNRLGENDKVLETREEKIGDVPIDILNLGRLRYAVDSIRRPIQIVAPVQ